MRVVITRVLPVPAPARTRSGPSVVETASRCAGLSDESRGEGGRGSAKGDGFIPRAIMPALRYPGARMRKSRRIVVAGLAILTAGAAVPLGWPRPKLDLARLRSPRGYDVRILRDTWGVPHVFGKTDP